MIKHLLIILILIQMQLFAFGQFKTTTIREAILKADTVMLVSHNLTEQRIMDEGTGKVKSSPPILLQQRPNKSIIRESTVLSDSARGQLVEILTQPNQGKYEMMNCFLPHHSILLFKNGKAASVEICFACQILKPSK